MAAYLELTASYLFASFKGRDDRAFTKGPAFSEHPSPTVNITSPEFGDASRATLTPEFMQGREERVPALRWENVDGVKQWLLIAEDVDAPLPTPICHGLYLGIPADKTSIENAEMQPESEASSRLEAGFYYGKILRGEAYIPPRPLLNHGVHRYFFDIVALSEPLDPGLVASKPARKQVAEAIQGKVLAWGRWTGECERLWK